VTYQTSKICSRQKVWTKKSLSFQKLVHRMRKMILQKDTYLYTTK